MNQYDNAEFFEAYSRMSRSALGLEGAGEWHQLKPMFPELTGKTVLDLGCGYGWHCKSAADSFWNGWRKPCHRTGGGIKCRRRCFGP